MKQTLINPNLAPYLPRPFISRQKAGRHGVMKAFEANRNIIAKLRQRKFSLMEIHVTLKNLGLNHSYPALHSYVNSNRY
tara:strand:+ start:675 stop:911 length:237 start_codon:yes stop_codon:yes gene_type:complete